MKNKKIVRQAPIPNTGRRQKKIDPQVLADALNAEHIDTPIKGIPIGSLRQEVNRRLKSDGGRPALVDTTRRQKIPLTDDDWKKLNDYALELKSTGVHVAPGQVASILLNRALTDASLREAKHRCPETPSLHLPPTLLKDLDDYARIINSDINLLATDCIRDSLMRKATRQPLDHLFSHDGGEFTELSRVHGERAWANVVIAVRNLRDDSDFYGVIRNHILAGTRLIYLHHDDTVLNGLRDRILEDPKIRIKGRISRQLALRIVPRDFFELHGEFTIFDVDQSVEYGYKWIDDQKFSWLRKHELNRLIQHTHEYFKEALSKMSGSPPRPDLTMVKR